MAAMILVALGSSIAASGFMLIGIALAIIGDHDLMMTTGWATMIGGLIVTVLGSLWYRANEKQLEAAANR